MPTYWSLSPSGGIPRRAEPAPNTNGQKFIEPELLQLVWRIWRTSLPKTSAKILAEVDDGAAVQRLMAAITSKEIDGLIQKAAAELY